MECYDIGIKGGNLSILNGSMWQLNNLVNSHVMKLVQWWHRLNILNQKVPHDLFNKSYDTFKIQRIFLWDVEAEMFRLKWLCINLIYYLKRIF